MSADFDHHASDLLRFLLRRGLADMADMLGAASGDAGGDGAIGRALQKLAGFGRQLAAMDDERRAIATELADVLDLACDARDVFDTLETALGFNPRQLCAKPDTTQDREAKAIVGAMASSATIASDDLKGQKAETALRILLAQWLRGQEDALDWLLSQRHSVEQRVAIQRAMYCFHEAQKFYGNIWSAERKASVLQQIGNAQEGLAGVGFGTLELDEALQRALFERETGARALIHSKRSAVPSLSSGAKRRNKSASPPNRAK